MVRLVDRFPCTHIVRDRTGLTAIERRTGDRGGFRGTIGYWISGLIFGLGFIWAAFDQDKEAWHDKLFDTWVVQAEVNTR